MAKYKKIKEYNPCMNCPFYKCGDGTTWSGHKPYCHSTEADFCLAQMREEEEKKREENEN